MICELVQTTVHGYFDGELDAVRASEFEGHLENCAQCQAALENIGSLRTLFQQNDLYEHASPQLRERIRKKLVPSTERVPMLHWRKWFLLPTVGVLAPAVALTVVVFLGQSRSQSTPIVAELIDAHVRSLQPGHLTDLQSTDQHTVKPWFDGKLDFIPPVSDYPDQGFHLAGGRLDVVDGHSVAALVYTRRKHIINLFVWPTNDTKHVADRSGSRQGYHWTMWRSNDMRFSLVSDVATADLRELKELIKR